jgi:hypothetical protein
MEPRIEMLTPKKLIGMRMEMSLLDNKTAELWRRLEFFSRFTIRKMGHGGSHFF